MPESLFALALAVLAAAPAAPTLEAAEAPGMREAARELLREGNAQLDQGLYLEALGSFQKAFDLYPSPRLHFNLAQTSRELGRPLEALRHYELFVRDVPRAELPVQWDLANERIFSLWQQVASVQVQCNVAGAQVTLDGAVVGQTPLFDAVRLLPGDHVFILERPGYAQQVLPVPLAAGESRTVRARLLTEEEHAASQRIFQEAEARRLAAEASLRASREADLARRDRAQRLQRGLGWTGFGVGLAGGVAGGVLGLLSRQEAGRVEGAATGTAWTTVSASQSRAETYRQAALGCAVSGGALVLAGAIALGFGYRELPPLGPVKVEAAVVPTAGGAALAVGGSF